MGRQGLQDCREGGRAAREGDRGRTLNLLLLEADEVGPDGRATLSDERARHLRSVLSVLAGSTLRAGLVDGVMGEVNVVRVTEREVVLDCSGLRPERGREMPERPRVDLVLALPRPKVLGRLYAALACLGIGRLELCNAARVERYYFDSHVLGADYVRARLLEGLSRARDTRLPEVRIHRSFRKLVEDELGAADETTLRIVADVGGAPVASSAREVLANVPLRARVLLAIGPEGGWVDFERALLQAHGFRRVGFGERVLSTDVACLAALAVVHEELRRAGTSER